MDDTTAAKDVARRFYAILEAHEPEALRDVCAPNLVGHGGAGDDLDELIANTRGFQAGFPDMAVAEIRHLVQEDGVVATWVTWSGSHLGEFAGVPPSGRRVRFAGWDLLRIVDGRIVELTQACDLFAILNQIGALPTTSPA